VSAAGVCLWHFGESLDVLALRVARGAILALPTESSYALAVDPRNPVGVEAIYRAKGREPGKPLPVIAADLAQLARLGVDVESAACRQISPHWPAPLSWVAPIRADLPAAAGTGSLAVRIPAHAGLRHLLAELGTALTATSANRAGEPPVLTPEGARQLLVECGVGDAAVVDGGELPGGPPSTLVRFTGAGNLEVLRRGSFAPEKILEPTGAP